MTQTEKHGNNRCKNLSLCNTV